MRCDLKHLIGLLQLAVECFVLFLDHVHLLGFVAERSLLFCEALQEDALVRPLLQADEVLDGLHALVEAAGEEDLVLVVTQFLVEAHFFDQLRQALHVVLEALVDLVDGLEAGGGRRMRSARGATGLHVLAECLLSCRHPLLERLEALLLQLVEVLRILAYILFYDCRLFGVELAIAVLHHLVNLGE